PAPPAPEAPQQPLHLLALSARTPGALREQARRLADHLQRHEGLSLADVCFTINTGRAAFAHRLALPCASPAEAQKHLADFASGAETAGIRVGQAERERRPRVAFLFTGQGSQYAGMGRQLYETQPLFRAELDRCAEILRPLLDRPLLEVLFPAEGGEVALGQTAYTQPALFALEYALARLWLSWGVKPSAVLGHSLGEYTAACVAGVFSLEDAVKLVAARARLMQDLPAG